MTKFKLSTLALSLIISGNLAFASGKDFSAYLAETQENHPLASVYMAIEQQIEFPINDVMFYTIQSLTMASKPMSDDILREAVNAIVHGSGDVESRLDTWKDEYTETVIIIKNLYTTLLPHNGPANIMQPSAYGALKGFFNR